MAKFAPDKPDRWGHMAFDMRFDEMEVVLELVKDRVTNLEFREIPDPTKDWSQPEKPAPNSLRYHHHADERIWEAILKTVFAKARANGEGELHVKDKRLEEAMVRANRKPSGLTPLLSWLFRKGKIIRTGKGLYKIP